MGSGELAIRELDFEAIFDRLQRSFVLTGNADANVATQLGALIEEIHTAGTDVTIDLTGLEFMAASCFNTFVQWIGLINELSPDRRYRLVFATNAAVPWQRRSLATLTCFATDIVTVEHR